VCCRKTIPPGRIRTARDFRPDLILLDIVMPEIDGGEVAARSGMTPELCRTPIIFLTALVTEAEAKSASRSTATHSWQSLSTFPSWLARSSSIYRTHERSLTGNEDEHA